ncbi:MAG: hypothetical protein EOO39_22865 [Cytophagaceae bacterium]|nr:MAG: hypothetical protein EOO39_22865 [Cytophagaceae bacterium]
MADEVKLVDKERIKSMFIDMQLIDKENIGAKVAAAQNVIQQASKAGFSIPSHIWEALSTAENLYGQYEDASFVTKPIYASRIEHDVLWWVIVQFEKVLGQD